MTDESPRPLGGLVREVVSLVRASDTFKLVTTEGAARLSARARERSALIEGMRTQLIPPIPGLREQREFEAILGLAALEADAQQKLAEWLRGLAGQKDGDHA